MINSKTDTSVQIRSSGRTGCVFRRGSKGGRRENEDVEAGYGGRDQVSII